MYMYNLKYIDFNQLSVCFTLFNYEIHCSMV
jgi:hypothetical protein